MRESTWLPEKPTATTPSSSPFVRNLGVMVEGEVMFAGKELSRSGRKEILESLVEDEVVNGRCRFDHKSPKMFMRGSGNSNRL